MIRNYYMWLGILIFIPFITINAYINNILIIEVELNPNGIDKGNEWVKLYNPNNSDISLKGWRLESSNYSILLNDTIKAKGYIIIKYDKLWLNNDKEHLRLYNNNNLVHETPELSDESNNDYTWQLINNTWQFSSSIQKKTIDAFAELVSVIDGDTINVRIINGKLIGNYTIRFADINAPEISTNEGIESKAFLSSLLNNLTDNNLYLDIDDKFIFDKYNRVVAVVYYKDNNQLINLNKYLVEQGYAMIKDYDNEFNPSEFKAINDYNEFNMSAIPEFGYVLIVLAISIWFILINRQSKYKLAY